MAREETDTTVDAAEVDRSEASVLVEVVTEGIVGAAGGLVGTAVTVGVLVVAASVGAFDFSSFATLAALIGSDILFPGRTTTIGFLVFFAHGMFVWPLFFASIGRYLPGDRFVLKGLPLGAVMWTGFVVVFYQGYAGVALLAYVVLTFVAHLGYGAALGAVFDYYSSKEGRLIVNRDAGRMV